MKYRTALSFSLIFFSMVSTGASSEEVKKPNDPPVEVQGAPSTESPKPENGIDSWGLGFGLGVEQYRDGYLDTASIRGEQRIVTTEKTYDTRPSAWLTLNWNIWPLKKTDEEQKVLGSQGDTTKIKYGLFAGVKIVGSNSDAFSSFALGPQATFETDKGREISVGFGWVTHGTKKYAKGINAGEELPAQYDDIVFEEGTENSYMLMMSVGLL